MATLSSFVASAKRHGLTQLSLKAKAKKAQRYKDTRGCGLGGVQKLLAEAASQDNAKAARDTAILRLAFGLGLRRNEIASLDIGHADLEGERLYVLGKGSRERIALTLPKNAKDALAAWLKWRNDALDAPLFVNLAHNSKGNRLSGAGVYDIIAYQLGKRASVIARPHGLRHAAITAALDAFQGDYRRARAFSRHSSLETVRRYDDARADHAGQVAAVVDGLAG
jgi:integrase/recombinase XerC